MDSKILNIWHIWVKLAEDMGSCLGDETNCVNAPTLKRGEEAESPRKFNCGNFVKIKNFTIVQIFKGLERFV